VRKLKILLKNNAHTTKELITMAQPRSSFGMELEFIVAYTTAEKPITNVPKCFEASKGGPMVLPAGNRSSLQTEDLVRSRLETTIAKALENHRGDHLIKTDNEVVGDSNAYHLRPYRDWIVGQDNSVFFPPELQGQEHIREYEYQPIEIQSPALWATDASFEEIRIVIQALADEYWILTPRSAGLHFHYGNGKEYIPFQNLRRIAAFLLAVDPIIVQLHPDTRRENDYCLSNRLYSRVAHGLPAAIAARQIGAQDVEEEAEFPTAFDRRNRNPRLKPGSITRQSQSWFQYQQLRQRRQERDRKRKVMFKRGDLTGYTFNRCIFLANVLEGGDGENKDVLPLDIPSAVREILRCLNAPTVAQLMHESEEERPAYSFLSYLTESYRRPPRMMGFRPARKQPKRTVEFRQQASTIVPEEIVAHGRVVVRLCEFAANADLEELWKIVLDCTTAEASGEWYDVFDLLAELGLNREARVLQRAVARFRGETVPAEFDEDEEEVMPEENAERRTWLGRLPGWLRLIIPRDSV